MSSYRVVPLVALLSLLLSIPGYAQEPPAPLAEQHKHQMPPDAGTSPWTFMQDGVVFGLFNHQGGPRGGDEFRVPNWSMWASRN